MDRRQFIKTTAPGAAAFAAERPFVPNPDDG